MTMAPSQDQGPPFRYRWFSRRFLPERRGTRCRIVSYFVRSGAARHGSSIDAAGSRMLILVEFETDGHQVEAERNMVKTALGYRATVGVPWRDDHRRRLRGR